MHQNMYLICNIGLAGGEITYCKSSCMAVRQTTQEKDGEGGKTCLTQNNTMAQTQPMTRKLTPHIITHEIIARKFFANCLDWSALQALFVIIAAPCYALR